MGSAQGFRNGRVRGSENHLSQANGKRTTLKTSKLLQMARCLFLTQKSPRAESQPLRVPWEGSGYWKGLDLKAIVFEVSRFSWCCSFGGGEVQKSPARRKTTTSTTPSPPLTPFFFFLLLFSALLFRSGGERLRGLRVLPEPGPLPPGVLAAAGLLPRRGGATGSRSGGAIWGRARMSSARGV